MRMLDPLTLGPQLQRLDLKSTPFLHVYVDKTVLQQTAEYSATVNPKNSKLPA